MDVIAYEHQGKTFITTPQGFISTLTYANYRHNRQRSPGITPDEWQSIYGDTSAMERRYQQELAHGT